MNAMPWRVPIITASTIISSGLIWLFVYSLNAKVGIGFDGPAGGILAMTILAGWCLGASMAMLSIRPFSQPKVSESVLAIVITGFVISFATGLIISQYALMHYPDNSTHLPSAE